MAGTTILALIFGNPLILWGLGLASAPIIIHLLSRRRFREMEWAAMKFLLSALKKNARRIRIEQLILLAVRTLLVALVVLAMGQPYLERMGMRFLAGHKTHKVIVLDGSFSMGYTVTDRSRLERAKEIAQQIIDESKKGDGVSLIVMGAPPQVIVGPASNHLPTVASEIDNLRASHGTADLTATLAEVHKVLKESSYDQKEVYVLSDLQRVGWLAEGEAELAKCRQLARDVRKLAEIAIVDLGQATSENLAMTSLGVRDSLVTVGAQSVFQATVRNFGAAPRSDVVTELRVAGRLEDRERIDVPAGEERAVAFSYKFQAGGDQLVEVRLPDDSLVVDNHRWLALPVKESVDVLVVSGEPAREGFGSGAEYLAAALAPEGDSAGLRSPVRPTIVPESALLTTDLSSYDCVFICNVGQFTESESQVLESYLRRGGGVVWFLGDHVIAQSYNDVLFKEGKGILPAKLLGRVGDAVARPSAVQFDPLGYRHPLLAVFKEAETAGLATTNVYEYFKVEPVREGPARVPLAYTSGDPAFVELPVGHGRAWLVTTTAGKEWTSFPVWPTFLPLVQELLASSVAGRVGERNATVGSRLSYTARSLATQVPVTVKTPDGRSEPSRLEPQGDSSVLAFDATDTSGAYRVQLGPPLATEALFAVNVDPRESDLSKLEKEDLQQQVMPGVEFAYLTHWQDPSKQSQATVRHRGEIHRPLLYAVLALLFVELFLAWRFGHYRS